jgi:hypothetical protein
MSLLVSVEFLNSDQKKKEKYVKTCSEMYSLTKDILNAGNYPYLTFWVLYNRFTGNVVKVLSSFCAAGPGQLCRGLLLLQ